MDSPTRMGFWTRLFPTGQQGVGFRPKLIFISPRVINPKAGGSSFSGGKGDGYLENAIPNSHALLQERLFSKELLTLDQITRAEELQPSWFIVDFAETSLLQITPLSTAISLMEGINRLFPAAFGFGLTRDARPVVTANKEVTTLMKAAATSAPLAQTASDTPASSHGLIAVEVGSGFLYGAGGFTDQRQLGFHSDVTLESVENIPTLRFVGDISAGTSTTQKAELGLLRSNFFLGGNLILNRQETGERRYELTQPLKSLAYSTSGHATFAQHRVESSRKELWGGRWFDSNTGGLLLSASLGLVNETTTRYQVHVGDPEFSIVSVGQTLKDFSFTLKPELTTRTSTKRMEFGGGAIYQTALGHYQPAETVLKNKKRNPLRLHEASFEKRGDGAFAYYVGMGRDRHLKGVYRSEPIMLPTDEHEIKAIFVVYKYGNPASDEALSSEDRAVERILVVKKRETIHGDRDGAQADPLVLSELKSSDLDALAGSLTDGMESSHALAEVIGAKGVVENELTNRHEKVVAMIQTYLTDGTSIETRDASSPGALLAGLKYQEGSLGFYGGLYNGFNAGSVDLSFLGSLNGDTGGAIGFRIAGANTRASTISAKTNQTLIDGSVIGENGQWVLSEQNRPMAGGFYVEAGLLFPVPTIAIEEERPVVRLTGKSVEETASRSAINPYAVIGFDAGKTRLAIKFSKDTGGVHLGLDGQLMPELGGRVSAGVIAGVAYDIGPTTNTVLKFGGAIKW